MSESKENSTVSEFPMPELRHAAAATHVFTAGLTRDTPTTFSPILGPQESETEIHIIEPLDAVPLATMSPFSAYPNFRNISSLKETLLKRARERKATAEKGKTAKETKKRAPRGTAGTKSKALEREGTCGSWYPCGLESSDLTQLKGEGFLRQENIIVPLGATTPAPPEGYVLMCKAWIDRGLSLPPSGFFLDILNNLKLQPHNIVPNSYVTLANFQTLCEGHLGVSPDWKLFQWYFQCRPCYEPRASENDPRQISNCGSVSFIIRARRRFPTLKGSESVRYWNKDWFYQKNALSGDKRQPSGLPEFKDIAPSAQDSWKDFVDIDSHPDLLRMAQRIAKLVEEGLTGQDLILSWFTRRIQPLSFRCKLINQYVGNADACRVTTNDLPRDSLFRRAKLLWKVPKNTKELRITRDIYTSERLCPPVRTFFAFIFCHLFPFRRYYNFFHLRYLIHRLAASRQISSGGYSDLAKPARGIRKGSSPSMMKKNPRRKKRRTSGPRRTSLV